MHLSVLVLLDKDIPADQVLFELEEMLRPYDENRTVEPYIYLTRQEAIASYRKESAALYLKCIAEIAKDRDAYIKSHYPGHIDFIERDLPFILKLDDVAIWEYVKDEYSPFDLDEHGNVMSIENPMSKWDSWQRGGRFKHSVLNTDGVYEGDELRTRGVESCRVKNLTTLAPSIGAIVTKTGEWIDYYTMTGKDYMEAIDIEDEEHQEEMSTFDQKIYEILLAADPDDLLTVVDVHF
jgi:hypothetical protein